ncbi:MAG: hypothetical protein ACM358_10070 [Gemmatimonadota bacterium]
MKFQIAIATVLVIGVSCEESVGPQLPPGPHMIVRFGFADDPTGASDFTARASRASLLDSVRAEFGLPVDQRRFLNGPIRAAASGENLGWTWAFTFDQWHLADATAELCDATPQYVQENLADWIAEVGDYCPWSAFVKDTSWVP